VSGLITGQDLKEQLSGLDLGEKLLIPCSMLKGDEEIFLDDMTLEELSEALNTEIVIVDTGGRDLVEAVIYPPEHKQTRRRQIYEQTSSSDSGKA
jgi:NifB/MoaA-like Fe-S oxidoreductase